DAAGGPPHVVEEAANFLHVVFRHLDAGLTPLQSLRVASLAFDVAGDHRGVRVEIDRRFVRHYLPQSENTLPRNDCRWGCCDVHLRCCLLLQSLPLALPPTSDSFRRCWDARIRRVSGGQCAGVIRDAGPADGWRLYGGWMTARGTAPASKLTY